MKLIDALPEQLRERTRAVSERMPVQEGSFILYWMRTAMRTEENPALDSALALSRELELPIFVYQGLSERYRFASDRHHLFVLQGSRDIAIDCARRGIGYGFHLEREGHRGPHLVELASSASVVITEEMPVSPLNRWTVNLASRIDAPLLTVDTACVVPMRQTPWPFTRAFEFRRATAEMRRQRLRETWPRFEPILPNFEPELPFEPIDLEAADFDKLIGECDIDHGIAPVAHTPGGMRAGEARWKRFVESGLSRYDRRRNDPLRDGVSRMSPYLHYGMVSPFRLAREAAEEGSTGSEKYLDELLVWREMAYSFCFHQPDHATVEVLPKWARRSLAEHEADRRPQLATWEQLARAESGDPLWDAAQTHLLRHGELHNNVRMTWGKAVLSWTRNAAEALQILEDLNHRFALDGRDPSSYGGILWCLGLLDRPFKPEQPIYGAVRSRPSEEHAKRLKVATYRRKVEPTSLGRRFRVLVVGAGLSGLACARTLQDAGLKVEVVDKGRKPGGRIASRSIGQMAFDHGAQYFTVRDSRFRVWVESWLREGIVAPWKGRLGSLDRGEAIPLRRDTERFVAQPTMSALALHLARDLEVTSDFEVGAITGAPGNWAATSADGTRREAEIVVLALPAPQATPLVPEDQPLKDTLSTVRMEPCWAVMASFSAPVGIELDGAFVDHPILAWAARNGSKPARDEHEAWVLHATPEWSRHHLETSEDDVVDALMNAFSESIGEKLPPLEVAVPHRWLHSIASQSLSQDHAYLPAAGLAACGDWCPGSRIEGAFLSGVAVAGAILRHEVVHGDRARGQVRLDLTSLPLEQGVIPL